MKDWLRKAWAWLRGGGAGGAGATRDGGTERQRHGAEGERAAAKFLRRARGMKIVARNWRSPRDRRDEIDLVCRDGETLVFVEVKTRAAGALTQGADAVDARKKKVLRRAVSVYLWSLGGAARATRFDVVEVERFPDGRMEVRHFENVPLFGRGSWM
ncbi:MAG: YraN family protein [Opitutaceae bacterium]|jgi:putative endonuclease|nr:YraN family protein [Opitutaceae bacterium]